LTRHIVDAQSNANSGRGTGVLAYPLARASNARA
jgi:hypothetical protein